MPATAFGVGTPSGSNCAARAFALSDPSTPPRLVCGFADRSGGNRLKNIAISTSAIVQTRARRTMRVPTRPSTIQRPHISGGKITIHAARPIACQSVSAIFAPRSPSVFSATAVVALFQLGSVGAYVATAMAVAMLATMTARPKARTIKRFVVMTSQWRQFDHSSGSSGTRSAAPYMPKADCISLMATPASRT